MILSSEDRKSVNTKSVSSISFKEKHLRIIFNKSYVVNIYVKKDRQTKTIPDFTYWDFENETEYNDAVKYIKGMVNNLKNFQFLRGKYINFDFVSSILNKYEDGKYRVIFNFNYIINHPRFEDQMTSDFIYFNFYDEQQFYHFVDHDLEDAKARYNSTFLD